MIQMKSIIIKWTLFYHSKKKLNKFGKNNEIKRKWLKGHNEKYRKVWQKNGFNFQFNHHVFIWYYQHGIILIMGTHWICVLKEQTAYGIKTKIGKKPVASWLIAKSTYRQIKSITFFVGFESFEYSHFTQMNHINSIYS